LYFLPKPLLLRVRQANFMLEFNNVNLVRAYSAFNTQGVSFIEMERALWVVLESGAVAVVTSVASRALGG